VCSRIVRPRISLWQRPDELTSTTTNNTDAQALARKLSSDSLANAGTRADHQADWLACVVV
jgi:hypothetical protein